MTNYIDNTLILNKISTYYNFKNDSEFSHFLGITPQVLSNWRRRNTINYQIVSTKCLEIDMNWVVTGEGEMTKQDVKKLPLDKKDLPFNRKYDDAEEIGELKGFEESVMEYNSGKSFIDLGNGRMQMFIPLVEQYAYAGYLSGFSNAEYIEELPKISIIVEKHHKGDYKGFNVRGDSMDDNSKSSISNGEIAIGRFINRDYWKSKLHLFQWQDYVIVHQEGIIIKRITQHEVEQGIIHCESLNPDKKLYPDFQIKLTEVYELYNIVQIIRNNF